MARLWIGCAVLVVAVSVGPHVCWGVGLNEEDVYDWGNPPADLFRPSSALVGSLCFDSGGSRRYVASVVVIQPNWVITAAHACPWYPARYVVIDGERYDVVDAFVPPPFGGGIAIAKIECPGGDPADLDQFVAFGDPLVGTAFTIGGFGDTYDYSETPPAENEPGILRWGRNTLVYESENSDLLKHIFDDYEYADYVKYEGEELNHDSGCGWFFRELYGWRLVGIAGAPAAGWGAPWFKQAVIDAIDDYPDDEYIDPYYGPPAADTSWDSPSSGNWFTSANWSDGVPVAGEVAYCEGNGVGPNITYGNAEAKELHIGPAAFFDQSGGTLTLGEVLVLGPGGGMGGLSGGALSVPKAFLGGEGPTTEFGQSAGTVNITDVLYLGACRYYILGSGATLNADRILFGSDVGNGGTIYLSAGECNARRVVLGWQGGGEFRQYGGVCTIGNLELAFGDDRNCQYRMYNGSLDVGTVIGGRGEDAVGTLIVTGGDVSIGNLSDVDVGWNQQYRQVKGVCNVTQSAGTVTVIPVLDSDETYTLSGGTLTVTGWMTLKGPLDFDNGSATLTCQGTVDLHSATITDADSATMEVAEEVLVLLPAGFDVENDLGTLDNDGIVHVVGQTLVIPDGDGFTANGISIFDHVEVQGSGHVQASAGGYVHLSGGVTVGPQGTVDLGGAIFQATDGSLVDNPSYFRTGSLRINPGTFTANGTLIASGELRMGGTLDIGPGVADLTIADLAAWVPVPVPGDILMDVGGLDAGESDSLAIPTLYEFRLENQSLNIRFADGFDDDVCPGDEVELISFDSSADRIGQFAEVTHDGPVGLLIAAQYDDVNGKISVAFSSWNPGDASLDGFVGQADLDIVLDNWGQSGPDITWRRGDLSGDNFVGQDDLDAVLANWGESM